MFRFPAEETFVLQTQGGKKIYGILNRCGAKPSPRALVISHGLTGHPNEHQHISARRYFNAKGYDVIRFSYYASPDDARKLIDCTLKIHAEDLNTVCRHFSPRYDDLYVAGHSYGGLAVLFALPDARAYSFWDSSFTPYRGFWEREAQKLPGTAYYTLGWGTHNLIGAAMFDEARNLTESDSIALAQKVTVPSQVILAGDSVENPNRTGLYTALRCRKELVEIKGADHLFSRGNTVQDLLETTARWFGQHSEAKLVS